MSDGELLDTLVQLINTADPELYTDAQLLQEVAILLGTHGYPKAQYPRSWYSEMREKESSK